ncbi:MAG: hypothetical protein ACJ77S_11745, partial [Gemmatimonadaceae bacterium]
EAALAAAASSEHTVRLPARTATAAAPTSWSVVRRRHPFHGDAERSSARYRAWGKFACTSRRHAPLRLRISVGR